MRSFAGLFAAALSLDSFNRLPDLPRQRREHGKLIHTGTYRRTFGEGHSRVERRMKRDARKQRRLEVMARN